MKYPSLPQDDEDSHNITSDHTYQLAAPSTYPMLIVAKILARRLLKVKLPIIFTTLVVVIVAFLLDGYGSSSDVVKAYDLSVVSLGGYNLHTRNLFPHVSVFGNDKREIISETILQIRVTPGCQLRAKKHELTIRHFKDALKVLNVDVPARINFNADKDKELQHVMILGNDTEYDTILALKVAQLEDIRRQEFLRAIERQYRLISAPWHPDMTIAAAKGCHEHVEAVYTAIRHCHEALLSELELGNNLARYPKTKQTATSNFEASSCLALDCLLYTSPSPRDGLLSRMPSSA